MQTKQKTGSEISAAEWEVMRIIWTLGQVHVGDVIKQLKPKKAWSESTIKTLMRRLVKKNLLETEKDGRYFSYKPVVSEVEMMVKETTALLDRMCDMHKGEILMTIVKQTPLNQSDIKHLQAELTKKADQAPVKIACNCLVDNEHSCPPK